jgi:hypothetical protein
MQRVSGGEDVAQKVEKGKEPLKPRNAIALKTRSERMILRISSIPTRLP